MALKTQSHHADSAHEEVVQAVADARGVTPLELERPLFDVIDPDCLDRLVESGDGDLVVTFEYYGCTVTVHGDMDVRVEERRAVSKNA